MGPERGFLTGLRAIDAGKAVKAETAVFRQAIKAAFSAEL